MLSGYGRIVSGLVKTAFNVAKYIKQPFLTVPSSVTKIVKRQPYGVAEVYNLYVPGVEHFTIEGGIVVHNSADAIRYLLVSLHEQRTPKPKTEIEKRIDALRRQASPQYNFNNFYES